MFKKNDKNLKTHNLKNYLKKGLHHNKSKSLYNKLTQALLGASVSNQPITCQQLSAFRQTFIQTWPKQPAEVNKNRGRKVVSVTLNGLRGRCCQTGWSEYF